MPLARRKELPGLKNNSKNSQQRDSKQTNRDRSLHNSTVDQTNGWPSKTINEDSLFISNDDEFSYRKHKVPNLQLAQINTKNKSALDSKIDHSLQYDQPDRLSVDTRIVPRQEFERIAHLGSGNTIEKVIYVVKPILVPHGTL